MSVRASFIACAIVTALSAAGAMAANRECQAEHSRHRRRRHGLRRHRRPRLQGHPDAAPRRARNDGVRCTNGYVSGPYCSPTRAGLLPAATKRGSATNSIRAAAKKATRKKLPRLKREEKIATRRESHDEAGLPLTETTMADRSQGRRLRDRPRRQMALGSAPQFHPQKRGFDEFFGFLGGAHGYFPDAKPPMLRGRNADR